MPPRKRHPFAALALALGGAVGLVDAARADEDAGTIPPPEGGSAPAQPPPVVEPPETPRRSRRVDLPIDVEVHGRLYMGISADERDAWERRLGMDEARIEVQARIPHVLTVVEADLAARTMIKDAFVRLDAPAALRVTAGRFKAPFLQRELESSWKLPLVYRGLVDEQLVDLNGLGGRRLGAMGAFRPWEGALEIAAGTFVGERTSLGGSDARAEDYAGRVVAKPWGKLAEIGVTGYIAAAPSGPDVPAGAPRPAAASAYVSVDAGPLLADVEGIVGRVQDGPFRAATALVGWTFRVGDAGRFRVTPIAGAEGLELRAETRAVGRAAIGGLVLGWENRVKLRIQGTQGRNAGDLSAKGAVAVQLATRF